MKLDELMSNREQYPDTMQVTLADGTQLTLGELRAGYMKDADYRRKTSELARQREELERLWAERKVELEQAEQRLRDLAAEVVSRSAVTGATVEETQAALATDPQVQAVRAEVEQLRSYLVPIVQSLLHFDQQMKHAQMQSLVAQHRAVLQRLKQEDPELDESALVQFAQARMIPRLDDAYRLMKYDKLQEAAAAKAKEAGFKEGYEKAKLEARAPWLPARSAAKPPAEAPKTWDEATQRALSDPEIVGPLLHGSSP